MTMISSRVVLRCVSCGGFVRQSTKRNQWVPPFRNFIYRARNTKSSKDSSSSSSQSERSSGNPLVRYLQSLRWVPIPLGVGFAYIGYQQYGHVVKREERKIQTSSSPQDLVANDWMVGVYKCLPLKLVSRMWGRVNSLVLPVWMREPLYKLYIWAFNCNLEEAAVRDLQHYRNLGEFFKRRLRPGVRPIDPLASVVCPSDGVVLYIGKSEGGMIEQVKGVTYSMQDFLGPPTWPQQAEKVPQSNNHRLPSKTAETVESIPSKMGLPAYEKVIKKATESAVYHCVIYLAPGDYHGFHSPTEWTVTQRRHFPGELLSVNPGIARLVRGLFSLNERAVYMGEWQHGFFSMAAVGATNVGSIKVFHDQDLDTNQPYHYAHGSFFDYIFQNTDIGGINMKKGDSFGEFNLGSTIVLVFEAPKDYKFLVEPGQTVRMGKALGHCGKTSKSREQGA